MEATWIGDHCEWFHDLMDVLKCLSFSRGECQEWVVLFFPTPRFFPSGFFLERVFKEANFMGRLDPFALLVIAGCSLATRIS